MILAQGMAKFESSYSVSVDSMESRKRKFNGHGVPLPYLIRPRRKIPNFDIFTIYNDYADNESDEDNSSMVEKAVETTEKKVKVSGCNCFGLGNDESVASLSEMGGSVSDDDEYVIVNNDVEADTKTERIGAIQMLELSKDVPVSVKEENDGVSETDECESDDDAGSDTGSNSGDEWVVV